LKPIKANLETRRFAANEWHLNHHAFLALQKEMGVFSVHFRTGQVLTAITCAMTMMLINFLPTPSMGVIDARHLGERICEQEFVSGSRQVKRVSHSLLHRLNHRAHIQNVEWFNKHVY